MNIVATILSRLHHVTPAPLVFIIYHPSSVYQAKATIRSLRSFQLTEKAQEVVDHAPDHTENRSLNRGDCEEKHFFPFLCRAGLLSQKNETTNSSAEITLNTLEYGYCNKVYRVDFSTKCYVAKIYSDVAKVRMRKLAIPADVLLSHKSLGPKLLHYDEEGIIMSFVDGATLKPADVHGDTSSSFGNGTELCRAVAQKVAALHAIEPLSDFNMLHEDNMLWFSLDRMMSFVRRKNACTKFACATDIEKWSFAKLSSEVHGMRNAIEALNLPQVFGHGDLKPSNVMYCESFLADGSPSENISLGGMSNQIILIDFEMTGLNYRGFDMYKLFRTKQHTNNTDENMRAFAESYLMSYERLSPGRIKGNIDASTMLLLESQIFEPLTVRLIGNINKL